MTATALMTCLLALPLSTQAGDFVHFAGGLRGGEYSGRVTVSGYADSESGSEAAVYPGSINRVALPSPNVADSEAPGYGVCEFYHGGWASESESGFIPPFIIIPHGEVEFEMSADIHAWAGLKTTADELDFSVDDGGAGAAYVESVTSFDGFGEPGAFTYELVDNIDFDEDYEDYVRVHISMTLVVEASINNIPYDPPYFSARTALDAEVIGAGDNDSFVVLRNDEIVWEAGIDGDFDPTANITIDARFGDTIGIIGGVAARLEVDSAHLDHDQAANENWTASLNVSIAGGMGLSNIPGAKATYAIPPNTTDPQCHFAPIDLSEKLDELAIYDPLWFSATSAPGYIVEVEGSLFTGVEFAVMGDGYFDVFLFDNVVGGFVLYEEDLSSGALLTFPEGTNKFKVMGFEEEEFMTPFYMTSPIGVLFDPESYPLVTITPVPEPATLILMTMGGLAVLRRRSRQAKTLASQTPGRTN